MEEVASLDVGRNRLFVMFGEQKNGQTGGTCLNAQPSPNPRRVHGMAHSANARVMDPFSGTLR